MATAEAAALGRQRKPSRARRLRRGYGRYWFAYAMLIPVGLVMAVLVLYPLVSGIHASFTNVSPQTSGTRFDPVRLKDVPVSPKWIGLDNYTAVLRSAEFHRVFLFTLVWTFVNVFFHFSLGLGLAMMLNRRMAGRSAYRVLLMIPWAVPTFISAFAWRFIFNDPYGFIYQTVTALGWNDPPSWLGDPFWAKVSVIIVNVWCGVPFMMVALLGGLQAIDRSLLEAADVDGATAWQRFWHVTLPGLRPVAATVILLGIIWTFNLFTIIFFVTGGGPGNSTQILVTFAFREFNEAQQWGLAAAWGAIILSMLLVFATAYRFVVAKAGEETWA
jgi:arabinogalactan oligomer/maltooligosaccharide transport system permease protein